MAWIYLSRGIVFVHMYSRYPVHAADTYCSIYDEGQRIYQDQEINSTKQPSGCHADTICLLCLVLFWTHVFVSDFEKASEKRRTRTA